MPVEKTAAVRQRRADDTRRWRERLHRGAAVYPVEVDGKTFDLMERFGGLKDSKPPQVCCGVVSNCCCDGSAPRGPAFKLSPAPLPPPKPAIACTS